MKCPRCAPVENQPMTLQARTKKTIEFHCCDNCRGVLLEKEAVLGVLQVVRAQAAKNEKVGDGYDYFNSLVAASKFTTGSHTIPCPKCRYNMYETNNRGIRLDFCLNCQSVWFDAGELQEILQRLRTGEDFNLIPLPETQVDHASGVILHVLRNGWL